MKVLKDPDQVLQIMDAKLDELYERFDKRRNNNETHKRNEKLDKEMAGQPGPPDQVQ